MARKPTEIVNFTLRLREDLRKRLERAADKAERSLNIEIVERLEGSFAADDKARDQKQVLNAVNESSDKLSEQLTELMRRDDKLEATIRLLHKQLGDHLRGGNQ